MKFASVASQTRKSFGLRRRHVDFVSRTALPTTVRSTGALTPACESGPALPASAIQKKSFLCRPSPAGSPLLPGSTFSPPPSSARLLARSRHFPGFSFRLVLPLLSTWPFFPRSLFSGHVVIYSFNSAARGLPRIKYHAHLIARI